MTIEKVALVYGGRSPIALALCRELANSGQTVHLVSRRRDQEIIDLAEQNGCADVFDCNLEDTDASIQLALKLDSTAGGLNCVAFVHRYRDPSPDPLRQYIVEVLTPYKILEALAEQPRTTECSVVITTSPAANKVVGDQDFFYHASKAALTQLVRFGSVRFAARNIRVNGISPGSFIIKSRARKYYLENPEKLKKIEDSIPSSRIGTPEELATVISFLLGPESNFVRGQILAVDGGLSVLTPDSLIKPE